MADLPLTQVVGQINVPVNIAASEASVEFTLSGFDADAPQDIVVFPETQVVELDDAGSLDIQLWPNIRGTRNTVYHVVVSLPLDRGAQRVPLGAIQVPETGPVDLNDLLPINPPSGLSLEAYLAVLTEAALTAAEARDQAQAAALAAEQDRLATAALSAGFADVYLGAHPGDPLADADGSPFEVGDFYFNTTIGALQFFDGTEFGNSVIAHSHTIAQVVGLMAALDGKSSIGHGHSISGISGLVDALAGKAPASHNHSISSVTGLLDALAAALPKTGGTLTGFVTAHADPTSDMQIATKRYVDAAAANPERWGASVANSASANDVAFAAMKNALGGRSVDLRGLFWPVTEDPQMSITDGGWAIENFDNGQTVLVPAPGFRKRSEIVLEGGSRALGWPQGNMAAGFGVLDMGFMPAIGHDPGTLNYSIARFTSRGQRLARFISNIDFGDGSETEVFAMGITPISTVSSVNYGPHRLTIGRFLRPGTDLVKLYAQPLALYEQSSGSGGLDYAEGALFEVTFSGNTFGWGIRNAVDVAYGVTTTGVPTLCHGICIYQAADLSSISFFTGFHGLAGAPVGPYLATVGGSPLDGTASITFVARIGLLNEGVEPLPVWYRNGGSSRLGGFIRSQGIGYPLRFFTTTVGGLNRENVEAADIQDCPAGLDFGTYSNIDACMRPRRKGPNSGWIPTWTTIDGDEDDEMHFVFTGKRTHNGSAGKVPVYHGCCTRGSGNFENFWQRAKIELVAYTYFANTNAVSSSNQTGTPGCTFIDADTFQISFAEEAEAAGPGDHDESFMRKITRDLSGDGYADPSEHVIGGYLDLEPRDMIRVPQYLAY